MSAEENKAIVRQTWEDLFNQGKLSTADELISSTFTNHAAPGAPPGPGSFKQLVMMYRSAFPDVQFEIEDLLCDGDKVVIRNSFHGTHKGTFMGIAPTGNHISQEQIHIVRVAGGQIVEHWAVRDDLSLMRQLGVVHM
ncbi:MAG: ester cyclase [Ktedonobacteraceae bacterium]|nr:ester cyclase [Ktedonobacteraceae bacterium]